MEATFCPKSQEKFFNLQSLSYFSSEWIFCNSSAQKNILAEALEKLEKLSNLPHCLSSKVMTAVLTFRNADWFDESGVVNKILFGSKVIITQIALPFLAISAAVEFKLIQYFILYH